MSVTIYLLWRHILTETLHLTQNLKYHDKLGVGGWPLDLADLKTILHKSLVSYTPK